MKIQELKEQIKFLRSQVIYLVPSIASEKAQGRKFASELCQLTEQIETRMGFEPTEKEQSLFNYAHACYMEAINKFN